jgi:hypothetical protein
MIIPRLVLLRMRNASDKSCRENKSTFNNSPSPPPPESRIETYGKAGQATGDNIIRRMHFAFWIAKAIDKHSEYVMLIAFPLQLLHTRASMLCLCVH